MGRIDGRAAKERRQFFGYALIILPAVVLGVAVMIRDGVSPLLWGQQLAAWAAFLLLAWIAKRAAGRVSPELWTVLLLLPLAATWFGEEAGGARRWLNLGIFHVNAAMLVLPALLCVLCRVKRPHPALLGAAVVLSFQPDVLQLTAFSAAAIPILWQHKKKRLRGIGCVLLLAALLLRCLSVPISIEPVSYCEGILTVLAETSWMLQAAGWAVLAAIPAFFMYRFCRQGNVQMLSLSIYYAAAMAFIFSGEYPVPFMGFGLSPIAGYYLAHICGTAGEHKEFFV